ncbi:hypothetical protein [uncultured Shewanella sp.]|nr:hypothetical protein [uncultured Shewanella sp.]
MPPRFSESNWVILCIYAGIGIQGMVIQEMLPKTPHQLSSD